MPRPPQWTDDDILDAAAAAVARHHHTTTVAMVADQLGGPTGSIYHRFGSREELLVRLWVREVHRFQEGLFVIADGPGGHDATAVHLRLVAMARHVPGYCRRNPVGARVLTLYRQDRLLTTVPTDLHAEVEALNDRLAQVTKRLTRGRYGSPARRYLDLVVAATRIAPYGLVRPYLGREVPLVVEDQVTAAADAILRLGDRP